jgi:hypothetical protein
MSGLQEPDLRWLFWVTPERHHASEAAGPPGSGERRAGRSRQAEDRRPGRMVCERQSTRLATTRPMPLGGRTSGGGFQ